MLLAQSIVAEKEIARHLKQSPARVKKNLHQLQKEGFLTISDGNVSIK